MASYQQTVKLTNKMIILNAIRKYEPISRAELAQTLNLTKATVSTLVDELIDDHYCYQIGLGESSGGRRPLMLKFNERAGYTISIDIGVNYVVGVLTDLRGTIIEKFFQPFNTHDFTKTVMEVTRVIDHFLSTTAKTPYGLIGIGFGIPGLVNTENDILITPNLDWRQSNLKDIFTEQYGVPVIIENEANAGAYGEKTYGSAQDLNHFIYVSIGIGIGIGLILNNELFRGTNGFTGEMGHMIVKADGLSCRCGSKGCWEMYASEMALLNMCTAQGESLSDVTLEAMIERAETSGQVKDAFNQTAHYLGIGINNIINTFNPEKIIIGNRLAKAEHLLKNELEQVIATQTLTHLRKSVDITFSQQHQHATLLGMTAFTIEQFLERQFYTDE
ncbi:ROK family transcriptional regulator [Salipaludibacillus agaradhaerens]|uniref:ROK family transcriptional regulator n=1 Tax=Salipaludibacillus agaradhaerens TaxID=76935 RepID=UPI0021510034|nr:ROK family transcriptional regulator [Salipaludibacillus agaradhaerens]MCR6107999.1 ROK family transcriptional regulator [Salipaludibacillus agaradhaerens]MCR6120026.1 ROK family transcriptional regulator [Salipaludibacillus agaradhaerens]